MAPREPWVWKPAGLRSGASPGLRYEPGNWGDVLKDLWIVRIVRAIAERLGAGPLSMLDPFAGGYDYPLARAARERLARVTDATLRRLVAPDVDAGRWPSSGKVALRAAREATGGAEIAVFDADPVLLETWRGVDAARSLDVGSGADALAGEEAERADLVLVDPYNLFDDWKRLVTRAAALASTRPVLLYLYNKSPRGEGHAEQYDSLRKALAREIERAGAVAALGRVPADAILPRAHHEVVLLGPHALVDVLRPELRAATLDLARAVGGTDLAAAECFEDLEER